LNDIVNKIYLDIIVYRLQKKLQPAM